MTHTSVERGVTETIVAHLRQWGPARAKEIAILTELDVSAVANVCYKLCYRGVLHNQHGVFSVTETPRQVDDSDERTLEDLANRILTVLTEQQHLPYLTPMQLKIALQCTSAGRCDAALHILMESGQVERVTRGRYRLALGKPVGPEELVTTFQASILAAMKKQEVTKVRDIRVQLGVSQQSIYNSMTVLHRNGWVEKVSGTRGGWRLRRQRASSTTRQHGGRYLLLNEPQYTVFWDPFLRERLVPIVARAHWRSTIYFPMLGPQVPIPARYVPASIFDGWLAKPHHQRVYVLNFASSLANYASTLLELRPNITYKELPFEFDIVYRQSLREPIEEQFLYEETAVMMVAHRRPLLTEDVS